MKLQVAEGALKISEVFFGLDPSRRELLERILMATGDAEVQPAKRYYAESATHGISWDEANLYWSLREARISRGDMYEHIADLEVELHAFVRKTLQDEFGAGEEGWWRKGVPTAVRKSCVQTREEDPDPVSDPFAYTTFINLSDILDKNWSLFGPKLPSEWASNRKNLMSDFARLNQIRNAVMHPVKNKRWSEQDFAFVQNFLNQMRAITGVRMMPEKALQRTVRFAGRHRTASKR